jgi:Mrp family chromosome partitioning ATPase
MKNLLQTLSANFDHIVIDSPPIANITDGVLLSTLVDGVVLVVHGGHSSRDLVKRARQLLRGVGARIFGVVLNNVKVYEPGYYYNGYYRNPYGSEDTRTPSSLSLAK